MTNQKKFSSGTPTLGFKAEVFIEDIRVILIAPEGAEDIYSEIPIPHPTEILHLIHSNEILKYGFRVPYKLKEVTFTRKGRSFPEFQAHRVALSDFRKKSEHANSDTIIFTVTLIDYGSIIRNLTDRFLEVDKLMPGIFASSLPWREHFTNLINKFNNNTLSAIEKYSIQKSASKYDIVLASEGAVWQLMRDENGILCPPYSPKEISLFEEKLERVTTIKSNKEEFLVFWNPVDLLFFELNEAIKKSQRCQRCNFPITSAHNRKYCLRVGCLQARTRERQRSARKNKKEIVTKMSH